MFTKTRFFAASALIASSLAIAPALGTDALPVLDVQPQELGACASISSYRDTDAVLTCTCGVNSSMGGVWGTDVYTDDSLVCSAGQHAGVIGPQGGRVTVQMLPGYSSYSGSTRNGVATSNYGSWGGSFRFVAISGQAASSPVTGTSLAAFAVDAGTCDSAANWRGRTAALSCSCPANFANNRSVWGTDVYTDDSYICRAAQHAGLISRSKGGKVTIELLPGQTAYAGSTRNGIGTSNYGSWAGSYRFIR